MIPTLTSLKGYRMKKWVLLLLMMSATTTAWCLNALDGKRWHVSFTPQDVTAKDAAPFEADIMFAGDAMTVSKEGFGPAEYNEIHDDGTPHQKIWIAEEREGKVRKADWRGQILADGTIKGLLTRDLTDGKKVRYLFKGESKS
jgi:hypothetical protein